MDRSLDDVDLKFGAKYVLCLCFFCFFFEDVYVHTYITVEIFQLQRNETYILNIITKYKVAHVKETHLTAVTRNTGTPETKRVVSVWMYMYWCQTV